MKKRAESRGRQGKEVHRGSGMVRRKVRVVEREKRVRGRRKAEWERAVEKMINLYLTNFISNL